MCLEVSTQGHSVQGLTLGEGIKSSWESQVTGFYARSLGEESSLTGTPPFS